MENKKNKVMVAIEESECSHHALQWALQNLRGLFADSELVIVTVQTLTDFSYIYVSSQGALPPELAVTVHNNQKMGALALLEEAKDLCKKYGILAETVLEVGDPKEAICEAVEKRNIKLLVVGTHGRGALKRAILGSVSTYCVHNAKCPVIVVNRES